MVTRRLNFALPNRYAAESIVAGYVLYLVFVPLFFPHVPWLATASMLLGMLEAIAHLAEIKIFRRRYFYSPGLVTAVLLLLPIAIYGISYAVRQDLMRPLDWRGAVRESRGAFGRQSAYCAPQGVIDSRKVVSSDGHGGLAG